MMMSGCGLWAPTHAHWPFSHVPETVDFSEVDDRVGFLRPWTLVRSAPHKLRVRYGTRQEVVSCASHRGLAACPSLGPDQPPSSGPGKMLVQHCS